MSKNNMYWIGQYIGSPVLVLELVDVNIGWHWEFGELLPAGAWRHTIVRLRSLALAKHEHTSKVSRR